MWATTSGPSSIEALPWRPTPTGLPILYGIQRFCPITNIKSPCAICGSDQSPILNHHSFWTVREAFTNLIISPIFIINTVLDILITVLPYDHINMDRCILLVFYYRCTHISYVRYTLQYTGLPVLRHALRSEWPFIIVIIITGTVVPV